MFSQAYASALLRLSLLRSTTSGVDATKAFFGGGSLAVGGFGMAGGTIVLGGLTAGSTRMVVGFAARSAADKKLEKARTNKAEAVEVAKQFEAGALQCEVIRRRTSLFYN